MYCLWLFIACKGSKGIVVEVPTQALIFISSLQHEYE